MNIESCSKEDERNKWSTFDDSTMNTISKFPFIRFGAICWKCTLLTHWMWWTIFFFPLWFNFRKVCTDLFVLPLQCWSGREENIILKYFYLTFFHRIHVGFIVQCSVIVREKNLFSHVHSACLKNIALRFVLVL